MAITSYLKDIAFAKIRVSKERRKLLTSLDRSVVLGRDARPKHLGKPTVIPNWNLVVGGV